MGLRCYLFSKHKVEIYVVKIKLIILGGIKMDRIIKTFMEDYKTEYGIKEQDTSKLFEYFINYCIFSKLESEQILLDKVNIGGSSNPGIDGMGISVNEHLVFSEESVDYFYNALGRLDVEFIFTQSKTSEKFEMAEINNFIFSVKNFFGNEKNIKFEDEVMILKGLKDYIFKNSIKMERSPACKLIYATTGNWHEDHNLNIVISSGVNELKSTGLFSEVKFFPVDAEKIKTFYREIKNKIAKEINFEKHTILPKINNVKEAYIGILQIDDFFKLICDEEGQLQRRLFYDNVRDFQGLNSVNREIKQTIEKAEIKDKFVLMNNGITIVSKNMNKVGTYFKISDFQIVNGCQTSNILYLMKEHISGSSVYIPIKLIVTDDIDVTNQITKATNRQTEVKNEAFEILNPFHKKLEEFYLSFEKEENKCLYYERRSKQYENQRVDKNKIITLSAQISGYLSMFLSEPHSTHRYYGELLYSLKNKIFQEVHSLYPYYTSALALNVIDELIRNGEISPFYKKYRFHSLMLFRTLVAGDNIPRLNSREIQKYCVNICEKLWDRKIAKHIFNEANSIISKCLNDTVLDKRYTPRLKAFTEELMPTLRNRRDKVMGTLIYFNKERGFGFIKLENNNDVFMHVSEVEKGLLDRIAVGLKFSLDIVETDKGQQARNVNLQE